MFFLQIHAPAKNIFSLRMKSMGDEAGLQVHPLLKSIFYFLEWKRTNYTHTAGFFSFDKSGT